MIEPRTDEIYWDSIWRMEKRLYDNGDCPNRKSIKMFQRFAKYNTPIIKPWFLFQEDKRSFLSMYDLHVSWNTGKRFLSLLFNPDNGIKYFTYKTSPVGAFHSLQRGYVETNLLPRKLDELGLVCHADVDNLSPLSKLAFDAGNLGLFLPEKPFDYWGDIS